MRIENRLSKKAFYTALFFVVISVFITTPGCGGGSDNDSYIENPSDCSIKAQNEFLYKTLKDSYLWYDKVPDVDYTSYLSPEELLEELKYNELDQWSYITSKEEYYNYFEEGKYIGIGCKLKYDDDNNFIISVVYRDSPVYNAGLKRGDKILEINNKTIEEIEDNKLWDTIFGKDEKGTTVNLKIEKLNGKIQQLNLSKDMVTINPVIYYNVLNHNNHKIAYLALGSFIETASAELDNAFAFFKQNNADELILDLRYNGGGRLHIARDLASLIAFKDAISNQLFEKTIHNDKYSHRDHEFKFKEMENNINLDRVFVITTSSTCSASESVINGLKPFIEVVSIGSTTCGKPVGMYGHDFCDKHISIIEFKGINTDGEGDYFQGITPGCFAHDDLDKAIGDIQEDSFKKALYYIDNGSCSEDKTLESVCNKKQNSLILKKFRKETGSF